MNSLSENVKNYFVVINSEYLSKLYKLCLEQVQNDCLVLIITSNIYDFSYLIKEMNISRDQLKNLIIMHYNKIDEISQKLLQLHNWSLFPFMVVVDLSQLLHTEINDVTTSVGLFQKVTLCTVSLLAYLQSIAFQRSMMTGRSSNIVNGLLILQTEGEQFGLQQIETLKNLYFYKTKLYQDFIELKTLLQADSN